MHTPSTEPMIDLLNKEQREKVWAAAYEWMALAEKSNAGPLSADEQAKLTRLDAWMRDFKALSMAAMNEKLRDPEWVRNVANDPRFKAIEAFVNERGY